MAACGSTRHYTSLSLKTNRERERVVWNKVHKCANETLVIRDAYMPTVVNADKCLLSLSLSFTLSLSLSLSLSSLSSSLSLSLSLSLSPSLSYLYL